MKDPLKVLQALPNLMNLVLYDGYKGEQLHIEGGGFQKLKFLQLCYLGGLNRLIIDEGAYLFLKFLPAVEGGALWHPPSEKPENSKIF